MRSKSDVENRSLLENASYPGVLESSLRITDSFALRPEYAPTPQLARVPDTEGVCAKPSGEAGFGDSESLNENRPQNGATS
jgi:hypothetical protein